MLHVLFNISNFISLIFYKVLYMSIIGSLIGILIFFLIKLFDNKLSAKIKCFMWIIPVVFLLIPINRIQININKNLSIVSAIDQVETALIGTYDLINDNVPQISYEKDPITSETLKTETIKDSSFSKICYRILPIIWISFYIIGTTLFIISNIKMHIKTTKTLKYIDYRLKNILTICKMKLKINKRIEIRIQDFNKSPCIYGIISPKILIPEEFITKDDKTLENIFMHELSHYKRRDMLTNYILLLTLTIHWFNPIVHYFFKRIRQDMELATDETALSKMNKAEKKQYGMTLISLLASYQNERIVVKSLCMADDNKNMERRIKMISLSTKFKKYKKIITLLVLITLICAILPFTIKPVSFAKADNNLDKDMIFDELNLENDETNPYPEENYPSINSSIDDYISSNISNNYTNALPENTFNRTAVSESLIYGAWVPFKAVSNGEEVSLRYIYGSSFADYGGTLFLSKDMSYSEIIGAYSEESISNLTGKFEILGIDNSYITMRLTSFSEQESYLTYSVANDIILQDYDGITVFFARQ